jgi:lysophospholipase L1-like esterase
MSPLAENFDYQKFLLFGDSIFQHCYDPLPQGRDAGPEFALGGALQQAYSRKLDVVCRGYHGYTSEFGKLFLKKILKNLNQSESSKVIIGTIFFGSNDCTTSGPQVVPLEKFLKNLKLMIDTFREYGIKPILCGVAKLNEEIWCPSELDRNCNVIRNDESHQKYSSGAKKLAREEGIPFIDNYMLFEEFGDPDDVCKLSYDGLHFNGNSYKLMFDELMNQIEIFYPEMMPNNIPQHLPDWKDFDPMKFD